MTTNSPNPVDGDVQVLIEFCESEVKRLQAVINCNTFATSELRMKLEIYKTALISMKAEPVAYQYQYASCETWDGFKDWRTEISTEMPPGWMMEAGKVIDVRELYATPPAQLLRQVELPDAYEIVERGPAYHTFRDLELDDDGSWLRKDEVIEALRQQRYEVKE